MALNIDVKGHDILGEIERASLTISGLVHPAVMHYYPLNHHLIFPSLGATAQLCLDTYISIFSFKDSEGKQVSSACRWSHGLKRLDSDIHAKIDVLCLYLGSKEDFMHCLVIGKSPRDPTKCERLGYTYIENESLYGWMDEKHRQTITLV
jgi:hypothetical protein